MIALGIDPGTRRVGYGLVEKTGGKITLIKAGLLNIKNKDNPGALNDIKQEMDTLIDKFRPSVMAIEKLFFVKNQKTGIQVAEARGIILLSAFEHHMGIREFAPNEVKSGIAGYGLADKKAVAKMVSFILKEPNLLLIDDASDALALAILGAEKTGLDRE